MLFLPILGRMGACARVILRYTKFHHESSIVELLPFQKGKNVQGQSSQHGDRAPKGVLFFFDSLDVDALTCQ